MIGKQSRAFKQSVGKRKSAIAQIKFFQSPDIKDFIINVNGQDYKEYFDIDRWQKNTIQPLNVTDKNTGIKIECKVQGGGKSSQSEAVSLGISRVLVQIDNTLKGTLKSFGLITRDPRRKERKKPGQKGARAKYTFPVR